MNEIVDLIFHQYYRNEDFESRFSQWEIQSGNPLKTSTKGGTSGKHIRKKS
jgi:hypothetical protein